MTIDEAIQHCKEQVQEQAKKGCLSCAEEHQQLAEWLKELKAYRSRSEIPNTCGDAISRKHLLEEIALLKKSPWFNENTYGSKVIRKEAVEIVEDVCIKREPSVTPQQRTGRWIQKEEEGEAEPFIIWECSECHCVDEDGKPSYKYCPQCGCKMQEAEE
jgi:hypothetical protein